MTSAILMATLLSLTPDQKASSFMARVALERAKIELAAVQKDARLLSGRAGWVGFYTYSDVDDGLTLAVMGERARKTVARLTKAAAREAPLPSDGLKAAKRVAACLVEDWAKPAGFAPESCDADEDTRGAVAWAKTQTTTAW